MVLLKGHGQAMTGYRILDEQHDVQLTLMDRLDAVLKAGLEPGAVWDSLDRLVEHVRSHFAAEQRLMRLHGFPAAEAHLMDHEHAFRMLDQLRRRCAEHGEAPALESVEGLRRWLTQHIETHDVPLGRFLSAKDPHHS